MSPLEIIILFQTLSVLHCHILRLKCKREADFTIRKKNHKIVGSPISKHEDVTLQECYALCLHETQCKSVNAKISNGEVERCELMGQSSSNAKDSGNLEPASKWDYHTTNFSMRLVGENCKKYGMGKCARHQTCIDICECPGYECIDCSIADSIGYHCNVCEGNPCGSYGQCIDDGNEFKCNCNVGYTGKLCATQEIQACTSSPCTNGICNDVPAGYTCICDSGFSGTNCDTKDDP